MKNSEASSVKNTTVNIHIHICTHI